ncbi:uncharacterized protein THITE_2130131 [Thermothielavioides terrestris NRRL 8126]|uniref:G-protein coupled receptors family 2 profile 2 domain-containing protein n=1 Tax=Thermothielavioides terrestris (strain ATCC 38088 / NRRL 8126) TaxID=578455 RepID=G2R5Z4_THETT|nr:uncharacterized protein THITE_2130131 [Thermothielavioides terrestris NRRL 8126]AEO68381.1 hypothetical protein THITE_2130131 [Thermothielavioides terrestris NRRL 8126]
MRGISAEDAESVVAIERTCSALSFLGCVFVLVTFSLSDAFRQRAINRLVFYATFGNMLTNVATLMTTTYIDDVDSFGCQLQAFLIQVFMQGDAYWALAMAVNVYLTFYRKYDARMLRKMEVFYFVLCYGVPFVPGFTFIFISTKHAGRPYGDAMLWCWLKSEWEVYRIATFYGPVWVAILIAMTIYLRTGREIYRKRRKMLKFSSSATGTFTGTATGSEPFSPLYEFSPAFNYKTTEVVQTTEIIKPPPAAKPGTIPPAPPLKDPNVSYSVTISADIEAARQLNRRVSFEDTIDTASPPIPARNNNSNNNKSSRAARALSSVQASIISGTTTTQSTNPHPHPPPRPPPPAPTHRRRHPHHDAHSAAWSYTKCAILFFVALLLTWIPSSGNRVYSLLHAGAVSRPLFFASAFVLPLQGFWNAIIYVVTSWAACKSFAGYCAAVVAGWDDGTSMEDLTGEGRAERVSPV